MDNADTTLYCGNCKKQVTWHLKKANHRNHFFIALVTLGMWIPMWIGVTFMKIKYCDICQSPLSEN